MNILIIWIKLKYSNFDIYIIYAHMDTFIK
jgi:hypothetical protein